jgi:putative ABC transport system permease protein
MLVSHAFALRALGSVDAALGRALTVVGESFVVTGVLPPSFDFPADADFWVPREVQPRNPSRTSHNLQAVGRLADGVTLERARTEVSGIARALKREHGRETRMDDAQLVPVHEQMVGNTRRTIMVLMAGSIVLLLIACANVVNLLIARMAGRHTEMALRVALGAGRARLVQQCLAESLMLAAGAAAFGVLVAHAGVRLLLLLQPNNLPRLDEVRVDGLVLTFAMALAVIAAVTMGVLAAWRAGRGDIRESLAHSQRTQAGSVSSERTRRFLVVAQVAMAVVLLVAAGLFGRSFARLLRVDMGFPLESQVIVDLRSPATGAQRVTLYDDMLLRFRSLPGVREAGAINALPLGRGFAPNGGFLVLRTLTEAPTREEQDLLKQDTSRTGSASFRVASPRYFEAMGIPLLRGRTFEDRDVAAAPHVAVISQSLATARWPNEDPIGKIVQFGNMDGDRTPFTVVGVVGDVRESSLAAAPAPTFYVTYRQRPVQAWGLNFVLAVRGDPTPIINPARQVVRELSPDAAPRVRTLTSIVSGSVADRRFVLTLSGVFGGAALLLATLGIYSVVSYLVAQREREMSIRIALGASSRTILAMVLRQGAMLTGLGIGVGAVIAVAATKSIESMLYSVDARDPVTFVGVVGLLALVALGATWIPARRAARAQPSDVMRSS